MENAPNFLYSRTETHTVTHQHSIGVTSPPFLFLLQTSRVKSLLDSATLLNSLAPFPTPSFLRADYFLSLALLFLPEFRRRTRKGREGQGMEVYSLLERYRLDRRKLLEFLLSSTLIREIRTPSGIPASVSDINLDYLSTDYVLHCIQSGKLVFTHLSQSPDFF